MDLNAFLYYSILYFHVKYYKYFNDKHDILIAGIKKYGDELFFPILNLNLETIDILMKYDILSYNSATKLYNDNKLNISGVENIIEKYRSVK